MTASPPCPTVFRTTAIPLSSSRAVGLLCLLTTAVGWGLNWPVMKVVLQAWPPLFSRGTAGVAAALGLALIAAARGESLAVPRAARGRLGLAAAINVFAWMGFATLAMVWLSVGEGALLVYTMPIWATLLAWPLLGVRPTLRGLAALALGIAGTSIMLVGPDFTIGRDKLPGVFCALAAAILFALGTVRSRTPLPLPPIAGTAWQVGLGCLPMVLLGLLFEKPDLGALGLLGWLGMAYMALVPMALCYLSWFSTLRRLPPATAAAGMLLVPIIGVGSAGLLLGEPLGLRELSALLLTLGGITLALRRG